jgi:hypothetical protein
MGERMISACQNTLLSELRFIAIPRSHPRTARFARSSLGFSSEDFTVTGSRANYSTPTKAYAPWPASGTRLGSSSKKLFWKLAASVGKQIPTETGDDIGQR